MVIQIQYDFGDEIPPEISDPSLILLGHPPITQVEDLVTYYLPDDCLPDVEEFLEFHCSWCFKYFEVMP